MQNSSRVNQLTEICDNPKPDDSSDRFFSVWGFNTEDLYKIALQFFKDKDGSKALQISYKDRLHLIALSKQACFGKFQLQPGAEIGIFDVVGNDRKLAWQKLGDMPKETAKYEFISSLGSLCPMFQPYVTAHKVQKEEEERKKKEEEEELIRIRRLQIEEEEMKIEEERRRQMNQEMMIRNALNQQTAAQFHAYAEQQYPGNKAEQDNLIVHLQQQHFVQYMVQVYDHRHWSTLPTSPQMPSSSSSSLLSLALALQMSPKATSYAQPMASAASSHLPPSLPSDGAHPNGSQVPNGTHFVDGNKNVFATASHVTSESGHGQKKPVIESASLWTRRDIKQFKESLHGEAESFINVRSGETVTVRIPTHEDGACLFWEFGTESHDIGFGVSFEWSDVPSSQLTYEVSNSNVNNDKSEPQWKNTPPTDVIIPVYRRDSHIEVYCGSHVYPGRGVYLFIFDNSYSLWRSKTVFYRVYYTR